VGPVPARATADTDTVVTVDPSGEAGSLVSELQGFNWRIGGEAVADLRPCLIRVWSVDFSKITSQPGVYDWSLPDEQVASVHGSCYPVDAPLGDTFFLRGADCWGWATWARAWRHFNADGSFLLEQLRARRLTRAFDLDGSHGFTAMLEDQVAGRNDSWAIRWHASCFLAEMLTLYPGRTLVENIGNDASGSHCSDTDAFSRPPTTAFVPVRRIQLAESQPARRAFSTFLRAQQPSLAARARRFLQGRWPKAAA